VGLNYTIFLGFRGEEVLLNRAECYILQNRTSLALADLQLLASRRYRTSNSGVTPVLTIQKLRTYFGTTGSSNDRLISLLYLLDERKKEFMHEGLRWFDIKRYQLEVEHILQDGSKIVLEEEDDRKVLQIPQAAIDVGGLKPNPR
jgi:hypothetical protein